MKSLRIRNVVCDASLNWQLWLFGAGVGFDGDFRWVYFGFGPVRVEIGRCAND